MRYFVVILMLLLSSIGWSQQVKFLFRGKIENIDLGKREGGVVVTIIQNGRDVSSVQSVSSGKYTLRGNVNAKVPFLIVFTKAGLVSKRVRFDFSKMNDEDTPASAEFEPVESLDIDLFKEREGLDFNFLDSEPVAAFNWNENSLGPKLDQGLVSRMRRKIEDILNKDEKEKAELEAAYQAALRNGQAGYDGKEYEKALVSYEEASALKPNEKFPADRILELDALIKAQKESQLAADQADSEYNNLIEAANNLRDNGELQAAVNKYKEAITKKGEQYPKDQVKILTAQIAELAKKQDNQAQYDAALIAADKLMKQNNLLAAKDKYTEASRLKPSEKYPKDKIQAIKNQLANQEGLDREYREAIVSGDKSMGGQDYQAAITLYNQAIALRPTEQEPKDKLKLAQDAEEERGGAKAQYEKILTVAQQKIDSEDLTKAEELIGRAEVIDPSDQRTAGLREKVKAIRLAQAKYQKNMSRGEAQATLKKYQDAINFFELAKNDRPSETEPDVRIGEMNRLIGVTSSVDQKQKLYQDNMSKGLATETGAKYTQALNHYQNALSVKPGDQPAKDKINEIQQILDDVANANSGELEKKNKFDALIKEANKLFAKKDYVPGAKEKYEEALMLYPSSRYAEKQRDESVRLSVLGVNTEIQAQYAKLLKVADKKFNNLDYDKAKELYTRAIGLKEADPYPKKKLAEIDAILNPVIAESVELKDLGIPIDATIQDGGFILESDDAKRRLIKKKRIQRKAAKAYASEQEMIALKTADRLDSRNEITQVMNMILDEGMESDENRLALIQALRIADVERDVFERGNNQFETAENLASQGTLDLIREDVSVQMREDDLGHMLNTEKVKVIQSAQTSEDAQLGLRYVGVSYEQDERLSKYAQLAIDETQDDYSDRLEIERKVNGAVDNALQVKLDLEDGRTDVRREQQDKLDGVREAKRTKLEEDVLLAGLNNEELKDIRGDVDRTTAAFQTDNRTHGYQTDAEISEVNRLILADNTGFNKVRVEATERLKYAEADQREADRLAYNAETEKYLANQATINGEIEKKKNIQEVADDAMDEKIANAKLVKERARLEASQGELTDEASRQNVLQSLDLAAMRVKEKDIEDAKKTKENADVLADVNRIKTQQNDINQQEAKAKALSNQEAIHSVDNTPQAKPRIKNALGEEYPEGVSQESFKNVDNEGLVKSIITRRIVVIDGHADIYVRTQTLNGITYSKNNNPSLSNVWNSETQGPDLVRNY